MTSFVRKVARTVDLRLVAVGVAGLALFVALLPGVHPDAAVDVDISPEEAIARADSFLNVLGAEVGQVNRAVTLRRSQRVLSHLQEDRSLKDAVSTLRELAQSPIASHYYRVLYLDSGGFEMGSASEVRLTTDGRIIHLRLREDLRPAGDARALAETGNAPDTAATADYVFRADESSSESVRFFSRSREEADGETTLAVVDPVDLASHHLARTAWFTVPMAVDSVHVVQAGIDGQAEVTFRVEQALAGMRPAVRVGVTARGSMTSLTMSDLVPNDGDGDPGGPQIYFGTGARSGALGAVGFGTHAVLVLLLLVLLFRRLDRRLIDVRGALRDALWGGLWILLSSSVVVGYGIFSTAGASVQGILLAVIFPLVTAAGAFILLFVTSAVGDSYGREAWTHNIRALDLARKLSFFNRPVGAALLHGAMVGSVILGFLAMVLYLPGLSLTLEQSVGGESARPVLSAGGFSVWFALYVTFGILAGVGGWLRHRTAAYGYAVPLLFLAFAEVAPLVLQPYPAALLVNGAVGGILLWTFRRHGFVAAVVSLALVMLMMSTAPGWLTSGSPIHVDATIAFLLFGTLLIFGFVAIRWADGAAERSEYVPSYVAELGEQQRIERELEIARHVQSSFLPRIMPQISGMEAAAVCLPANEVGGDYYDVVVLDECRVAVVIGDVSGKGIEAAFYMTLVKGVIQTLARSAASPHDVLIRLNTIFLRNAPRGTFISLIYGVFDVSTGRFNFARAGHTPVLVISDGAYRFERPPGMAIGLAGSDHFAPTLEVRTIELDAGDVIVLFTDGVSEAVNERREQFGEERIAEVLAAADVRSADRVLSALQSAVDEFADGVSRRDDMTMIVLQRTMPALFGDNPSKCQSNIKQPQI